ncbi:MAG: hypothetical protein ACFFFC_00415 [Candidatus Thorarchaeota archaeon]
MNYGIHRKRFQVLPGGERIVCVRIRKKGWELFEKALASWERNINAIAEFTKWDYVQIAPLISIKQNWTGNDGMQAWRYQGTGYTIPDYCRQIKRSPEAWVINQIRSKRELSISNLEEIAPFVIFHQEKIRILLDFKQTMTFL